MKQASVIQHIGFAIALSCIALINQALLQQFFNSFFVIKLNLAMITCLYLSFLIWQNRLPVGRLILLTINIGIILISLEYIQSLPNLSVLYLSLIWITRCLLRYTNSWAILTDLAFCIASIGIAFWVFNFSHSTIISLWCLLLVQALHTLIPSRNAAYKQPHQASSDNFEHTLQTAERVLQQLLKQV